MDFNLTEEQKSIYELAQSFAQKQLLPHASHWDETSFFPVDTIRQSAQLGFGGLYVDEEYGGCQLSRLQGALVFEGLAMGCIATTAYISIHNMVGGIINSYASVDQKKIWLPRLSSMEWLSSYCLTEPNAGSDAASLKTTAQKDGDSYILNGSKVFISGGGVSDVYLVMARTGEAGPKGISAFLVEKGTLGLRFGKKEEKMGWRSQPTCTVAFDDCRIPAHHLIGSEGTGFQIAMGGLDGGRINIAACSLGGAHFCLERAKAYVKERYQFGHPLSNFQAVQFKIADMETQLSAARLMVYRAAYSLMKDHHANERNTQATLHCAMAKSFATDAGFHIANTALQLHGGYGYIKEYQIERIVRDLRVHQILEGTNEIMQLIISRKVLG